MNAALASIAIEHGATLYTTDRDFTRFAGLAWKNPLDAKHLERSIIHGRKMYAKPESSLAGWAFMVSSRLRFPGPHRLRTGMSFLRSARQSDD